MSKTLTAVLLALTLVAVSGPPAHAALPSVAPGFADGEMMNLAREAHTMTLLTDGRVLVTGGFGDAEGRSAEIYDRATNTWTPVPNMSTPRINATATRLLDGRVLVVGGAGADGVTPAGTAEIYNPATNRWSPPASLQFPRSSHSATLLADGKVVIAGGILANGDPAGIAERFDPAVSGWSQAGTVAQARWGHIAVRLANGKILIGGGGSGTGVYTSSELYDPAKNSWSPVAAMTIQRSWGQSHLLANGKVFVFGGGGSVVTTAEFYDPVSNLWSPAAAPSVARNGPITAVLPDGRIAIFGGYNPFGGGLLRTAEVYDPADGKWSSLGGLGAARGGGKAVALPDGRVLIAGGDGDEGSFLATTELYTPPTTVSLPARFALGEAVIDASTTKSVTLTNTGKVPLLVADPEIAGRHQAEFKVAGTSCANPVGVAPGASCSLSVTFTPTTPGNREGALTFQTNASTARLSVALDGVGFSPPEAPVVVVTPPAELVTTPPVTTPPATDPSKPKPSSTVSIRFDGGYNLPPGVSRARACRGTVSLTLKLGKRVLVRHTVSLDRRCRFKTAFKVQRKSLAGATRLTVVQHFNGNRALGKRTDRIPVRVP